MNKLPLVFTGILLVFGFAWLGLVSWSANNLSILQPVPDEATGGVFPPSIPGLAVAGEKVYASNGCVECHSQQVRLAPLTTDIEKELGPRQTVARDYLRRTTAFFGTQRIGQDLSNYGTLTDDANAVHLHLFAPRSVTPWSNMPSYSYLYKVRKIQGQPSNESLVGLTGPHAPKPGYEVVPTEDAKALVAYLLSLNQTYPLPESPVAAK
jgi:cytochrome c oxidase cbb3-type subunit II